MKKRKITYSLTAQQKKKLKRQQGESSVEKEVEQPASEVAEVRKSNKKFIICATAIFLAVAMIVVAILIPIWTAEKITNETFTNWKYYNPADPENPYTDENPNPNVMANPIATITFTGDNKDEFKKIFGSEEVKVEIEIFMDDAPYSGMNFMYLAESGFYNNTLISDTNRGKAMFSGFTNTDNSAHKAYDSSIVNLKGFLSHNINATGKENFKLGYRLSVESKRNPTNTTSGSLGYLAMMAGSSSLYSTSTAFMLITQDSPQLNFADETYDIRSYLSWVGVTNNAESKEILRKIDSIASTKSGKFYVPDVAIRIKSIKTNLSKARRKYLLENFESLITSVSSTNWKDTAFNKTYYKYDD